MAFNPRAYLATQSGLQQNWESVWPEKTALVMARSKDQDDVFVDVTGTTRRKESPWVVDEFARAELLGGSCPGIFLFTHRVILRFGSRWLFPGLFTVPDGSSLVHRFHQHRSRLTQYCHFIT